MNCHANHILSVVIIAALLHQLSMAFEKGKRLRLLVAPTGMAVSKKNRQGFDDEMHVIFETKRIKMSLTIVLTISRLPVGH